MVTSRSRLRQCQVGANAKRKFVSRDFRQTKCPAAPVRRRRRWYADGPAKNWATARSAVLMAAAERDAKIHRRQRGGAAAPAALIGLLKGESLLDPDPVRDRKAVTTARRGSRPTGFHVPARAGAA